MIQNPLYIVGFVFIIAFGSYLLLTRTVTLPNFNLLYSTSTTRVGVSVTSPPSAGSSQISSPPSGSGTPTSPQISPSEIPSGFTLEDLSPFFHKVRMNGVSPGGLYSYSQVNLSAYGLSGGEAVDITGWLFKGNSGSQYIPQAVALYDPSGLSGEGDIVLKNGDMVSIYSTVSPIGRNLRLNKCIGYLENAAAFNPSLSRNCPYINRSSVGGFTGRCQDYIMSLSGSCRLPASNPPIAQDDYACRAFLDTLNYNGCYSKHASEPDFLDREWRVWTGSKFLDDRHDRVRLLDRQGLLVDLYEY